VTAVPELERSAQARSLIGSARFQRDLARVRAGGLVDHREAMSLKRRVLDLLAAVTGPRNDDIERFASAHPRLDDYAAFRAACERRGSGWEGWPAPERHGSLPPDGGDPAAFRYHRYAQFLAEEQISSLSARAKRAGAGLYFDASLGVSRAGYDVWRDRDVFALGASTGAPPDAFFAGGQDWGSPPLHPEGVRRQGYRYLIEAMRHAVRHADVVRIDHVMWLHRLFWIPRGFGAREGVYVRYPTDELYGILTLEAARSGTIVVGEDLGTVPAAVRTSMARHGLLRSFVLELDPEDARPPRRSVASLNTHDLPPFAAYWRGRDARRALEKSLHRLAESPSRLVLVNLEDLWLDPRPQNVPGTSEETNPNWRRRARHGFEELRAMPEVVDVLRMIHRARR
jgi:4-alpha-glucanotransferase